MKKDRQTNLICTIDKDVMFLTAGLKLNFNPGAGLEKMSAALGRNALWKESTSISRLPLYLMIQENRFYYKLTPQSRDHQGVNCKMMKPVAFPMVMDLFDLCDDNLKALLKVQRAKYDADVFKNDDGSGAAAAAKPKDDDAMEVEGGAAAAAPAAPPAPPAAALKTAGIGLPENFDGRYELFGVVTHKGRSADSGHYMGWVRQGRSDEWYCFDDEHPSQCGNDEIKLLKGGGDHHMAYLLFYRFYTPEPEKKKA